MNPTGRRTTLAVFRRHGRQREDQGIGRCGRAHVLAKLGLRNRAEVAARLAHPAHASSPDDETS
jgi:hypothetical protein